MAVCNVVSCCVMLCHVVSCCVMLCHVVSCCVMLCHVVSCCVMLCHVVSCCVMLCHVVSCCVMLCHVVSCCVMLCHVVSCCVMLCHVVSCCVTFQKISGSLLYSSLCSVCSLKRTSQTTWKNFGRLRCANAALKHEELTRKEAPNGRGEATRSFAVHDRSCKASHGFATRFGHRHCHVNKRCGIGPC